MSSSQLNIGIIGAGVAGLAAARRLMTSGHHCVLYDRNETPGGVWADGYLNFGVQVHKELYQFPDWPPPAGTPDFTPGIEFQRCLEGFAAHFGIREHIRTSCRVLSVEPHEDGQRGWTVVSEQDSVKTRERVDVLVVATGLYSETPLMPSVPGLDRFKERCCTFPK